MKARECICPPIDFLPPATGDRYEMQPDGTIVCVPLDTSVGIMPGPRSDGPVHGPAMRRREREERRYDRQRREEWRRWMRALGAMIRLAKAAGSDAHADLVALRDYITGSDVDPT